MKKSAYSLATLAGMFLGGCTQQTTTYPIVKGNDDYVRGALAYQEGDRDRAVEALQLAIQENPDLIMARFLLGTIHKEKGQYEAAVQQFQQVVALDPYAYTNHYNLGLVYHLLNRLQEAASSYLQALNLNPQDLKSNMYLGLVYTALGKPQTGLPYATKATEINPQSAEAHANLAVVLDAVKDYPAAELAYRRAIELDSDRVETVINLAGNLAAQKRYKESISVYEQALKKTNSSLLRQRYGYALLGNNQYAQAIREFQTALELNSRNYQAMNGLGDALLAQYRDSAMLDEPKRTQAMDYLKKSLDLNPNQPRITALVKEYVQGAMFP
ncbi:MAG TPA: tetratricopeptide repeat protein [Tepidisphaeraceae bacterium]|nr:tetratricopeptide repeat protein [Tepidisphaeraceae bacterium]